MPCHVISSHLAVAAIALQYGPSGVPISVPYHVARVPTSLTSHATSGCLSLVRRARYPVAVGTTTKAASKPTAVYALILANLLIFFSDKILLLLLAAHAAVATSPALAAEFAVTVEPGARTPHPS